MTSEKKAAPGWYSDARWPGKERRWDGSRWLDEWRATRGLSPLALMLTGVGIGSLLGVLSGIVLTVDTRYGWPALWVSCAIGGTIFAIGLIAKGVEVGIRAARD